MLIKLEYLDKSRPCGKVIIKNLKKSDAWKIKLMMAINFMSSIDIDEELLTHSKSDTTEIKINNKVDEAIEEPFQSLLSRYQIGSIITMKSSSFIFDCVHLLNHDCNKINPTCGGSYILSPNCIKNKKQKTVFLRLER